METNATLPSWAEAIAVGKVEINAEEFYPAILAELWADENWPEKVNTAPDGEPEVLRFSEKMYEGLTRNKPDSYWFEVAFQVAKMDIQSAVSGSDLMPKKRGALVILVKDGSKSEGGVSTWNQDAAPKGRNVLLATRGREARAHYSRIRALLF